MSKTLLFLILAFLSGVAFGTSAFDTAVIPDPPLLRDGFVLRGVDGRLSGPDSNDAWFFELAADVNDFADVLKAGAKLQILPSSTLENMIADAQVRSEMTFRLWNGRVTRYKSRNFIFPSFFLPLREVREPEPDPVTQPQPEESAEPAEAPPVRERDFEPVTRDPNDVLTIPIDLLEKLQATRQSMAARERRIIDSTQAQATEPNLAEDRRQADPERYSGGSDSVFVDRTAFLVDHPDGGLAFMPDALGRNVGQLSLRLLPCEALELAESKIFADFEPVRFKIAGVLTKYEDTDYLLLQKATPVYSHGNFGR